MRAITLFLAACVAATGAQAKEVPVEAPPVVPAADLLPADVPVSGTDYTIDPEVQSDGFAALFVLRTRFEDYLCSGREMLFIRLHELRALEEIDRVSKTGVFAKAITQGAIEDPVEAAVKIAKNPAGSLERAPLGAARLVGKVAGGFVSAGEALGKVAGLGPKPAPEPDGKPPPDREDPIGYNQARNQWARKFGVDPYTTNRPLALKLNHLAMISFSMDKIAGEGSGIAMGGLGTIAEWLSYLPDVDEHLLTKPPADIAKYNERRLLDMGIGKEAAAALLGNAWFTPPLQLRFVNSLVKMKDAANVRGAMVLAAIVESEEQARFVCQSLELLGRDITQIPAPRVLGAYHGLAAATGGDGSLLVAASADLLSWTQVVKGVAAGRAGRSILCINGAATRRAEAGFASMGWQLQSLPPVASAQKTPGS